MAYSKNRLCSSVDSGRNSLCCDRAERHCLINSQRSTERAVRQALPGLAGHRPDAAGRNQHGLRTPGQPAAERKLRNVRLRRWQFQSIRERRAGFRDGVSVVRSEDSGGHQSGKTIDYGARCGVINSDPGRLQRFDRIAFLHTHGDERQVRRRLGDPGCGGKHARAGSNPDACATSAPARRRPHPQRRRPHPQRRRPKRRPRPLRWRPG